ncbi:MAG: Energy-coupling factor transporter transmembrane protein EcfT [Candidatus Methanofastidiosum methylothiophilum]|uniref:Energy-coupling factor transporter transmembrane protein EcfT n=1 Tax=Candidatus Methanofastidiosum methylothiophilum TaxID=1705564 RepID=A0A150JBU0_9EURY|nr:MAG: Energy-coupling factor transporter transmembrane protein EcfT [Candidatus Methanofastidiosum methylthiophilus]NMC76422.1 energy-coupling factor transporter transmembrane protein EcfT [Candidatus Methanofastidiosa archaeon]
MIKYSMYVKESSFFHSLDPRTKIVILFSIFGLALLYKDPLYLGILAFLVLFIIRFLCKIKIRKLAMYIKPILPLIIMSLLLWPFFQPTGKILLEFWQIKVSEDGIKMGLAMTFRIFTIIIATFLLLMTTLQRDLVLGLMKFKVPYEYCLTLAISLRYVPTLAGITYTIMDAQRSRGLELDKGPILKRIKNYVPIITPLIIGSIRMAEELAIAIESRGFGYGERTFLKEISFRKIDYFVIIVSIIILMLGIYIRILGYGEMVFN